MACAMSNAQGVDLNTASAEQLKSIGGLGPEEVRRILAGRPFKGWDDLRKVKGLGDILVDNLRRAGARLDSRH
ncbi:MAG TPA: helix-hairpin-helix domain-containing protein [Dongiaceae bacterium]|nr:helix-hairpin-helix domain-containing protein [Dongiaceae bacterium]